ncbi:hypothetical protein HDV63DRAFT_249774 [Trichoderma sp. SZMC 28014]
MGGPQLLLTTIVHHHLTLTPSNESWCYADPPTPRWHTPRTLVQTQALRWTPSSTPNRTSARTGTKYRALFRSGDSSCKLARSARPTVELAPWRRRLAAAGKKKVRRLLQRLGLHGRRMARYRP